MEQFEQLLTCAICLDRYRNPKLLPCQHSFCMEPCMDGLVDYVRRQVKCPECRAEHRIPYQGVQGFPTNVTLQRFLELHIEITGELPDPTSGQTMERCSVCSEKNYLNLCVHCDKKICPDCKGAHMDILRREISRINNQVRRALHRLHDALGLVEKHASSLRTNCSAISEEVDEIYRRLAKALKDRTTFLTAEIERYLSVEQRSLATLKENLQQEISNIESNCELADKHMTENVEWDDAELMDAKEIFLRTVEFIRNFEYESMDYTRRVRFSMTQDPNQLVLHVANYGDLTINMPHQPMFGGTGGGGGLSTSSSTGGLLQPPGLNAGPGLMRSKSEHRLAAQMRHQDPDAPSNRSGYGRYGADAEEPNSGRLSPLGGRKFGERPRNNYGDRYGGGGRTQDYPELESPYDEPGSGTRRGSRFRSRFRHDNPDSDPDTQPTGRSVRFSGTEQQKERERVLDTEDVARGPLSGIFRLYDSPRVMKRLQDSQRQHDKPKEKPKETPTPPVQVQAKAPVATRGATQRQVSEEDEITRIKKLNKAGAAAVDAAAAVAVGKEKPTPPSQPTVQESSEAESDDDITSLQQQQQQQQQRSKTTSRRSSTASDGAGGGTTTTTTTTTTPAKTARSASSDSGSSSESTAVVGKGRERDPSRDVVDGLKKALLTPSTNTPLSSSAVRNTGAAYTTDEVKQKFLNRGDSTTSNRSETKDPPRFQSRFLGASRGAASTPAPQEKKEESEESSSESDSSESSSEEEEDAPPPTTNISTLDKSDIGALLARSQHARDTSEARRRTSMDETPTTRPTASRLTSGSRTSSREETEPATTTTTTTRPYTSRFLNRSRSSAALSPEEEEPPRLRYSTTSASNVPSSTEEPKFGSSRSRYAALKERRSRLSRSKSSHNFGDDDDPDDPESPTSAGIPASYLPSRYGPGELSRSRSTHALKSRDNSPERGSSSYASGSTTNTGAGASGEKDGAALSSWARYLKNKYGTRGSGSGSGASGAGKDSSGGASASSSTASRRLSLGLPLRHTTGSIESSDDDQKNLQGSPTTLTAAAAATAGIAAAGMCPRAQYMAKRRQLFKIGGRGSEPGCFTWPRGLAVGPDNSIVVADSSNHRVQVFDSEGVFLKEFGSYGNSEGEFDCLAGVAVNRIGQFIIADRYNHRIQVFDPSGRFLRAFGSQGTADGRFNYPWGITTDALGFIYVCDKENHRVQVFQSDGTFVGKFGSCGSKPGQLEHPHYIAVSSTNRVIVSDSNNHRVQIFDVNGRVLTTFGTEGSEEGQFKFPRGVAVDEQGYIFVADSGNNRIQIFHPDGTFLRAFGCWGAGDGEFKGLEGVAVMSNGNILVCDRENHRVQVF